MRILVHNRFDIAKLRLDDPHIVIQVTSEETWPGLPVAASRHAMLRLRFHDQDPRVSPDERTCESRRIFTRAMADEVLTFVRQYPGIAAVVCQCDFGVSRSSALAAALGDILNGDSSFIFDRVPERYRPNLHIYRLMLERNAALETPS